jgi:hypothetical protein
LATFGATTYVLGSALAAMPMALWMAKVGAARFMAVLRSTSSDASWARSLRRASAVACTGIIGVYNAVGLQYRFAAAGCSTGPSRPCDLLVLAGGVVGGLIVRRPRDSRDLRTPFRGSLDVALFALAALAVQVGCAATSLDERTGKGRPLSRSSGSRRSSSPCSRALGYGLMNLLMTATPIAMDFAARSARPHGHRMACRGDVRPAS